MAIDVLNKHHGRIPEGAVYIGRPSKWGNPYTHLASRAAAYQVSTREAAVEAFRWWMEQIVETDPAYFDELLDATALVCWCAPNSCHGDVIAEWLEARRAALGD